MAKRSIVVLDEDQATLVRKALRIGLTCYGEIERSRNCVAMYEISRGKVPDDLRVLHPTGSCDVVSDFAAALCYLG